MQVVSFNCDEFQRKCNVGMLIYTSSASIVCDIERDVIFADETYPTCPNSSDPYRKSKSIAEHIVLKANSRELMTVSLRPSSIYKMLLYLIKIVIYGKGDSFTSKITWLGEKGLSRYYLLYILIYITSDSHKSVQEQT
jgi:nucleoside-diphosphate-sugar epimerase